MMKIPEFTVGVRYKNKPARYEALGSTNIVMDYAARHYIALNGLARMKHDHGQLQSKLLTQFKLILYVSLAGARHSNPACDVIREGLDVKMPEDLDEISGLGLVTADVRSTSSALRYLACNGSSAPLDAQDGIGFEIMVQHHLFRLCEAWSSSLGNSSQFRTNAWLGQYSLRQAWPPSSRKGDEHLNDSEVTMKEVKQRYRYSKNCNYNDIGSIKDMVEKKDYFYLVMRQTASNAQGADLMILSGMGEKLVLDLFQCKNWDWIPGEDSKALGECFRPLGVKLDQGGKCVDVEPNSGSAGYSYLGTQHFAEELGKKLGKKVEIGNRIVIFSKKWEEEIKKDFLEIAKDKGVMVWTWEMLEPTISALFK